MAVGHDRWSPVGAHTGSGAAIAAGITVGLLGEWPMLREPEPEILVGSALITRYPHWWAQSHHYNTAGTIAMTAGGAVVGGVAGYYAAEGVSAATAGRGLGFGGYRIAIHLAHTAFLQTFKGGIVRTVLALEASRF